MKKLLSLLSVLTISGSSVPTIIASSSYQKEKDNLGNSENNYLKINTSNRNKRANEQECPVHNIIAPILHIEWDDSQSYVGWIQRMTAYLINNGIIENINNEIDVPFISNQSTATYGLTGRSNINYFFIPIQLNNNIELYLVFNSLDLYFRGFINIVNNQPNYYVVGNNQRNNIINFQGRNLTPREFGVSENYARMWPIDRSLEFSQILLTTSFRNLINHRMGNEISQASLARIIFITAEALRFNEIWQLIGNSIIFHNVYNQNGQLIPRNENSVAFDRAENNGQRFNYLNHWGDNSRDYLILTDDQRINLRILNLVFLQSIRNKNQNNCLPNNRRSERSTENNKCYGKKFYYDEKSTAEKLSNRLYEKYGEYYIAYISYSGNSESYYGRVIQFDLGNINPLNFKKIRIIYKNIDNIFVKASLGEYHNYANNINYGKTINDFFKENNIKDIIKNESVISKERVEDVGYSVIDRFSIIDQKTPYFLLDWKINSLVSKQKIGLNFYWKENHYYLQILLYQYAYNDKFLGDGGILRMGIGKGIELYNY